MSKEFISFRTSVTVGETIEIIREIEPDEEVMNYIYVTDESDNVKGIVKLGDLLLNDSKKLLKDIMDDNIVTVNHDAPVVEVIELTTKYDLLSIAVIDDEEKLIGIVQLHDIIDEYLYPLWKKKNKI